MCHYLMAFRVRSLGLDHRRPTTKFLQFYVSGHLKWRVCFHLVVKPKCKHLPCCGCNLRPKIVRKSPCTECWECFFFFLWFPQFLLLSSMCQLATPRSDLDQPGWICRLIPFVEAQWLSGRMPDSRSRGHRHESSTHIGAVDDDSLWRCYSTTTYNLCTIVLCNKLWFILFIYNTVAPLKLPNDFHRKPIYLCKMYDSPPGIVGTIISMTNDNGTIWSNEYKSQMPSLLTLMNGNRTPTICMYCHQKWKCGFLPKSCSFPKSWHMFTKCFHC